VTEHIRQLLYQDTAEKIENDGSTEVKEEFRLNPREPPKCPFHVADGVTTDPTSKQIVETQEGVLKKMKEHAQVSLGKEPRAKIGATKGKTAAMGDNGGLHPKTASQRQTIDVDSQTEEEDDSEAGCKPSGSARRLLDLERLASPTASISELRETGTLHVHGKRMSFRTFSHPLHPQKPVRHTQEEAKGEVKNLVKLALMQLQKSDKAPRMKGMKRRVKDPPAVTAQFRKACSAPDVRRKILEILGHGEFDNRVTRYLTKKLMGACSGSLRHGDADIEDDLVKLAQDSDAPIFVRSRALYPLMRAKCPSQTTVKTVQHLAAESDPTLLFSQASILALGALILNHRKCRGQLSQETSAPAQFLNRRFIEALEARQFDRARVILLAMTNSGAGEHLAALHHGIKHYLHEMTTPSLKDATAEALHSISKHPHDHKLRFSLLAQIRTESLQDNPSKMADADAEAAAKKEKAAEEKAAKDAADAAAAEEECAADDQVPLFPLPALKVANCHCRC